jgi:hypothetical protein
MTELIIVHPMFLEFIDIGLKKYPVYAVPILSVICSCSKPMCYCGCTYDFLSFTNCKCDIRARICISCGRRLAFCRNGLILRGFIYSDITTNIRFTDPCSCNGLECFFEQYTLITKKERFSNGHSEIILFETKTYFQNDNNKLEKTDKLIHSSIISNIHTYFAKHPYYYNTSDIV